MLQEAGRRWYSGAADLEKGIDGTCYLIGFKKDILELQRFNNGVRTAIFADASLNPAGGPGYPNKGTVFEYGKKYHITVGRIMEKDGVRVILNIDGKIFLIILTVLTDI